jgi:hypothetical protein
MEQIHKKTTNGIGHNSNILKEKSPTVEAMEEQLSKVGKYINNITSKLWRIEEKYRGAHGDEIVVNPHEVPKGDDPFSSNNVYRKANKYERGELHFEAKEELQKVHERLNHIHLNIDSYINGTVKEVTDKQKVTAKKSERDQ